MAVLDSLTLYSDMLDYITALTDGGARTKDLRMYKEAILGAYRETTMACEWSYYIGEGRVDLVANYSTGTIAYDHTGGSSERMVTLSGGTWPTWIQYGRIRISDVVYEVDTRVSGTVITLTESSNPGADIAAGTSYQCYRSGYPLPTDMWRIYDVGVEKNNWVTYYISPTEWQQRERYLNSGGQTWAWTIMKDPDSDGRWALFVDPYPTEAEPLMFMYRRKPRTLRWTGTEVTARSSSSQTATASNGASTITTSSALPSSMVGSIIRLSDTTVHPTGLAGINPYYEQHKITGISSTTVTIDGTIQHASGYSGKYFVVSDPIDMSESLIEAFKAEVEFRLARLANDQRDISNARAIADRQIRQALEAESRHKGGTGYNRQTRYAYLFSNLQNVITTSSG